MGKSLKSAKDVLDCLRTTKWDLFNAVTQIQDHRQIDATQLIKDVCIWLKTDEHALAGGLSSKLSEAEAKAIKLLTPPKVITPVKIEPSKPNLPDLPPFEKVAPKQSFKPIGAGGKTRMSHAESITEAKEILRQLNENPKLRLTVQWTLEEEGDS